MAARPIFDRQATTDVLTAHDAPGSTEMDRIGQDPKMPAATEIGLPVSDEKDPDAVPTVDAQAGVRKAEAVSLAWSKSSVAITLICIWFMFLANGFRLSIIYSLTPFATSSFAAHSLLTVIDIVSSAMSAATYIPVAKMLDMWGRAEGFVVMVAMSTLGLIMMAASTNLPTYCAAQVFYSIGFAGTIYAIEVVAVDATSLRNRGLAFAFTSSPYMITAFAGSKAAEGFYNNINWHWGFGAFAIITPAVAAPLYTVLRVNLNKAKRRRLISTEKTMSGTTIGQMIWHIIVDFDLPGVVLLAGGLVVFLLPFNIASSAPNGWATGYIIAMIIVGIVLLVMFGIYQRYLAPSPFMPWHFLTDRSVIGACLLNMTYQISYYCWNYYFTSFLQVVYNVTVAEAGYINSTFQVVSGVLLFIVGYSIRRTGRFRWLFYIAVPLYVFALGLMIHFRKPNGNIGYIIMCEILISIGGAVFILICQLAVLAAVDHQHTAAVLSVLFITGNIGGSIGAAISGAIWTNTFETALMRYLPASAQAEMATIYSSLVTQLAYPVGSEERLGIQRAYGYAQTRMLAAGTAVMCLSFIWMFLIRDTDVRKIKQTRGVVF